MPISNEQWKVLEESWTIFSTLKFSYEGRVLIVQSARASKTQALFKPAVFIDGFIRQQNGIPSHKEYDPFVIKVWWNKPIKTCVFSKQQIALMQAKCRSARQKKELSEWLAKFPELRTDFYTPYYPSIKALIRQFKKLEGIEVVEI